MKKLSLLFLAIIFITPIHVWAGKSNKTDARNKKSLNNVRRCPGTNLMFKYKLDRKKYFKENFSARPIEKILSNVIIYRCGIEGCSSVKTTFGTKIKCWHHMLIATKNHDEKLQNQKKQMIINSTNEKQLYNSQDASNDENDLVESSDSFQSCDQETASCYIDEESFSKNLEPLFIANECTHGNFAKDPDIKDLGLINSSFEYHHTSERHLMRLY